eukprot:COSAG01_NODE_3795_length_5688_cov_11.154410_5_plen_62_part_00
MRLLGGLVAVVGRLGAHNLRCAREGARGYSSNTYIHGAFQAAMKGAATRPHAHHWAVVACC